MIQVSNLTKYYGPNKALDGLTFAVESGAIIGLVGKNGAGKSTALRILSCQLLPTQGDVTVDGISVTASPMEVRRQIGYLPEQPPLYPEMTVVAYLEFAARLRGLTLLQARSRREIVMRETGLTEVATQRLGDLSRGYQQRVGIAQAIVHQPRVVLLDEPMAGLDPLQIVQIRELIRSFRNRHTVIFSSHILSEIENVCDRVVLIDQGSVRAEGSEAALRDALAQRRRLVLVARGSPEAVRQALSPLGEVEVEGVLQGADGTAEARLTARTEVREQVSQACQAAGLALLELRSEHHLLEDLFVQLLGPREAK
jgi:ABC-2 type transport system ATP-binding protein